MIKRIFDVIVSLFILLIFILPLIILAILVKIKLGSPILFLQERPGLKGGSFTLIKFRTMKNSVDEFGILLPDIQRLTRFGRFLRSTSLDELPELLNVLKGEMSLVGPRPLLMDYLSSYSKEEMRRHDVVPGITGWAQINGRNQISWDERFQLDIWYVDNQSFWLDLKILIVTILSVLRRDGVMASSSEIMPYFKGSHKNDD